MKTALDAAQTIIYTSLEGEEIKQISDGHHTFDELYDFRMMYNALLFNEWATEPKLLKEQRAAYKQEGFNVEEFSPKYDVHKSWKHETGEDCFAGSKHKWFVVVAMLPGGQITNHYKEEHWNLFKIPVTEKAKYVFDGHGPKDTLVRMREII